jgi:hypothetical protein
MYDVSCRLQLVVVAETARQEGITSVAFNPGLTKRVKGDPPAPFTVDYCMKLVVSPA